MIAHVKKRSANEVTKELSHEWYRMHFLDTPTMTVHEIAMISGFDQVVVGNTLKGETALRLQNRNLPKHGLTPEQAREWLRKQEQRAPEEQQPAEPAQWPIPKRRAPSSKRGKTQRSSEEMDRLVEEVRKAIAENPDASLKEIGEIVGIGDAYVSLIRRKKLGLPALSYGRDRKHSSRAPVEYKFSVRGAAAPPKIVPPAALHPPLAPPPPAIPPRIATIASLNETIELGETMSQAAMEAITELETAIQRLRTVRDAVVAQEDVISASRKLEDFHALALRFDAKARASLNGVNGAQP